MATAGLCVIKKSAKTAKLDNVFEHIFTPRIYQVSISMWHRAWIFVAVMKLNKQKLSRSVMKKV